MSSEQTAILDGSLLSNGKAGNSQELGKGITDSAGRHWWSPEEDKILLERVEFAKKHNLDFSIVWNEIAESLEVSPSAVQAHYRKMSKKQNKNIPNNIVKAKELLKMEEAAQRKYLLSLRNQYNTGQITAGLGMSNYSYNKLLKDLGIVGVLKPEQKQDEQPTQPEPPQVVYVQPEPQPKKNGLNLSLTKTMSAQEVAKRILNIASFLEDVQGNFAVNFTIEETEEEDSEDDLK